MTTQTKNYIALSDILAIRCECNHCGATVSLPIAREVRTERLHNCPNCNEPWTQYGYAGKNIDSEIAQFVAAFQKLFQSVPQASGFSLSLEISGLQSGHAVSSK